MSCTTCAYHPYRDGLDQRLRGQSKELTRSSTVRVVIRHTGAVTPSYLDIAKMKHGTDHTKQLQLALLRDPKSLHALHHLSKCDAVVYARHFGLAPLNVFTPSIIAFTVVLE